MKYLAFDGKVFENEAECRAYERENDIEFACRTIGAAGYGHIQDALNYVDTPTARELAACLEKVAYRVGQARRAAGDVKRRVNKATEPAAEPDYPVAEASPPEPPAPPSDDPFAASAAA